MVEEAARSFEHLIGIVSDENSDSTLLLTSRKGN